ncbi:hypothetical protein ACFO25_02355 [Paenactinomyces guangxiensis]|uniref:Uncharacterized protein n=1 Tax=Paenactinomyces guangxiensis TaxID=1490290 RepID=A0A7W1WUR1_9BACL|nr:hypothetical protein [Paenactinomyces guangxiensis]MBA4496372.1 hypothetical protein [Paenactinomyces guangxiensis]MBH8593515.1 hypothetical protein [Paenactinomyces guangxiensis]
MGEFEKVPEEVRRELNKLYREGAITRKQLMQRMKNGLFDHERLAVKEKFKKWAEKYNFK